MTDLHPPAGPTDRIDRRASERFRPSRDSPKRQNGFTVLEMLMVLLIIAVILSCTMLPARPVSLSLFSRRLLFQIQREQFSAYEQRTIRKVAIDRTSLETEDGTIPFPDSVTCSPQVLLFNPNGNITKGGTVRCTQGSKQIRLVFQLGAGKGRIDYETD